MQMLSDNNNTISCASNDIQVRFFCVNALHACAVNTTKAKLLDDLTLVLQSTIKNLLVHDILCFCLYRHGCVVSVLSGYG
jgi:hypothetical protein